MRSVKHLRSMGLVIYERMAASALSLGKPARTRNDNSLARPP